MKNPYFNLLRSIWFYGAPWRLQIIAYYIAFIIAQLVWSLSPYAFGQAIDVLQHFEPSRLNEVIYWLVFGVVVMLVFWVFHGPARVVERRVALKIQQAFRIHIYEQMTRLPLKWHQSHHSGDIITRLNRSSTSLLRFAEHQFVYIETIIQYIASVAFLFWISVPVGLVSLLFSVIVIVPVILCDRRLIPLYAAENEVENKVGSTLFDYISNMTTVLTLRLGNLTRNSLFKRMLSIWPPFREETTLNEVKWFIMMTLLSIFQAVVLIGYVFYSLHYTDMIMIGLVVMIFRYQWELNNVFHTLSMQLGEIVKMDTDVSSIDPILDDIAKYAHAPQGEWMASHWHVISVENLVFHHEPGSDRGQIFDGVNFEIKRGEKMALIGYSGGGKSTLMNLLSGFYSPTSVTVKVDGLPFNNFEPIQSIATLIPQDPEIFENTIAFNITLDLPSPEGEMEKAMRLAAFTNVLKQFPQGLETEIREKGQNLSVGQKQRLALARGLFAAKDSSLILMDEPTSSVDLPTEKAILNGVIEAYPDKAMIISLHRLHLLNLFDTVVMLDKGKVIAHGSVKELLSQPGPVYDLWKSYIENN